MPRDICKLCLQDRDLCDSHYLPKSLYKRMLKEGGGNPIVMTPGLILSTSRQVRDYVLCSECEQRFSSGGERYFMRLIADEKRFPIVDKLRKFQPFRAGEFLMYPGALAGIDPAQVAHFSLGLLWKGAVHSRNTVGIQITRVRPWPDIETVRRYLLGAIGMPANIMIFVLVCLDRLSQVSNNAPYLIGGYEHENRYEMLLKGIKVQIAFGPSKTEMDKLCFYHAKHHPIFAANCHNSTLESAKHFHRTAHLAKNLPVGTS